MDGYSDLYGELEQWETDQARLVASAFPDIDSDDLAAQLFITVLTEKRRHFSSAVKWKAYLSKALYRRAARLAKKWRMRQTHEVSSESLPEAVAFDPPPDPIALPPTRRQLLRVLRCFLDDSSVRFVVLLMDSNFNMSALAQAMRIHRNTARHRWKAIQNKLRRCPIEMYSAAQAPLSLTPSQRFELCTMANREPSRTAHRAKIILALAQGLSYREVEALHEVTARTIALWKFRLQTGGIRGLTSHHRGATHRRNAVARLRRWLELNIEARGDGPFSSRRLARQFGLGKSTVHRLVIATRRKA